jgi:hypothetical protein
MDSADCSEVRRGLNHVRRNRRSQSPMDLASLAVLLGYTIDKHRGKGSHWYACGGPGPHFPIPTNRDPVAVGVTTRVLRILEEVYEDVCGS